MWILVVWTHQSQSWILAQSLAASQLAQEEREERKGRPRHSEEEWRWVLQRTLKNRIGRGRAPSQGHWDHRGSHFSAHTSRNYVLLKQWWLPMPSTHCLWQSPLWGVLGHGATFTGISFQRFQRFQTFLWTSQFLLRSLLCFSHPSVSLNSSWISLYL